MTAFPARRVIVRTLAVAVLCFGVVAAPVRGAITFGDQPPPIEPPPPKPGQNATSIAMPQNMAKEAASKEALTAGSSATSNGSLASVVTFGLPAFVLLAAGLALFGATKKEKRKRHRRLGQVAARRTG